ncbi:CoA-transferase family III domain-containing protein [Obelidium mucronatum]|nr:CoA-transferase family III domain-containing protein [Obelidium mucronatum]
MVLCPTTPFHVEKLAATCVKGFASALSNLTGKATQPISAKDALLSFFDERLFRLNGEAPALWDPISGDYRLEGGDWIRLHCNFSKHRSAVLRAFNIPSTDTKVSRDLIATRIIASNLSASEIVHKVESLGGCAAKMQSLEQWKQSSLYNSLRHSPIVSIAPYSKSHQIPAPGARKSFFLPPPPSATSTLPPLHGLRVLDLTRVLAGPICCKTLAAQGASVIHVSSATLDNLGVLDIVTGVGKRSILLDLKTEPGILKLKDLIREADVLVQAYRPGALDALGLGVEQVWRELNPGLVYVSISAYGVPGKTGEIGEEEKRRGFDSLVQMVTGICREGQKDSQDTNSKPVPLPCQALDHATGWFAAGGVLEALQRRKESSAGSLVQVSLARTSVWLEALGRKTTLDVDDSSWKTDLFRDVVLEDVAVRGSKNLVLTQVSTPVVVSGESSKSYLLGPPETLGLDSIDGWDNM